MILLVAWSVEFTDEFGAWWERLTEAEQDSIDVVVHLLEELGPSLKRPYSGDIKSSKFGNMRELIIQHQGSPYRVFYAFDPRRTAILLIGGDKTGNDRFYEEFVPKADRLYAEFLAELEKERPGNG
jgi:hypothetical protein